MHGAGAIGSAAASKAEGSRFDSVAPCQCSQRGSQAVEGTGLQVRLSPRVRIPPALPPSHRLSVPLAQWIRAAGFYPAGRGFESFTGHHFINVIPIPW
jgi:hypothetical protein